MEFNWVDVLIKLLVGLGQFGYALILIWLSIKFHLFLMNRYKKVFFRDEMVASFNALKSTKSMAVDRIYRHAAIVFGASVYQGMVFIGILHLMANMQTPFG